jgi:fatty-acyl-CoA synthase
VLHADLLGERALLTPEREAIVLADGTRRLTYGELDQRTAHTASALASAGVIRGERFALLSANSIEFLQVLFSAAKSGAIIVPLSTRATIHELEGILADSGARVLVYGPGFESAAATLQSSGVVEKLVALPRAGGEGISLGDLLSATAPSALSPQSPEDLFALLYTSGTTGKPKGVMIPHRMVAWNAWNTAVNWSLREEDRSPIFTPLYHAGGLGAFLTPIFAAGGTIVLHERFDPAEVWRVIERERCTVVLGVPTIWKMLLEAPEFATVDLASIRWLISGGAPLPAWIIEKYQQRGVVFKQGFGMTEVGVNCFSMTVEDSYRKPGSIGRPMMYTRARIIAEDGSECGADEVGELQLHGPHVSMGYWNAPEATSESYLTDGWFRTGDSARRDTDGFYYIAGRKKEMFISGGVNVYPAEIEAELLQNPQVADAAVIGVEDEKWGESGVAFVVLTPGSAADQESLTAWLAERLSSVKHPRRWIFVDALPRSPYGKVEKPKLKAMLD